MAALLDVRTRTLHLDGSANVLTEREVEVLLALRSGAVVSRAQLIRDADLGELSSRRCEGIIMALRRHLGQEAIVNLRRRGWRLTVTVDLTADDDS